jgi:AraC-like DNA-binding protein
MRSPRGSSILLGAAVAPAVADPTPASAADRRLVAAARAAIDAGDPVAGGLRALATSLDVSPWRLSRAFTRELGVPLTRYRNRVRVARVMDRLAAGEDRLGVLAADLGFADQAHLCRTVRAHLGHTPTELRRLLGRDR